MFSKDVLILVSLIVCLMWENIQWLKTITESDDMSVILHIFCVRCLLENHISWTMNKSKEKNPDWRFSSGILSGNIQTFTGSSLFFYFGIQKRGWKRKRRSQGWTGLDTRYMHMMCTECPTELLSDRQKQQEEECIFSPSTSDERRKVTVRRGRTLDVNY